jgi:hypothetical protein
MVKFGQNYAHDEQKQIIFEIVGDNWPNGVCVARLTRLLIQRKQLGNKEKSLRYHLERLLKEMVDEKRLKKLPLKKGRKNNVRYVTYKTGSRKNGQKQNQDEANN